MNIKGKSKNNVSVFALFLMASIDLKNVCSGETFVSVLPLYFKQPTRDSSKLGTRNSLFQILSH